jgi:recombination protein RecT
MNNLPAIQRNVDPQQALVKMLNDALPEMKKIAPKFVNLQRLVSLAIEARKNPILAKSSPMSVLNFCKKCAEWGTDRVGAGGVWAVPFWSEKLQAFEMTPIPDWRLLIEKAKKAKAIKHATAEAVYENDIFEYERGLTPTLRHVPARTNRGKITAVYCAYILPDDTKDFVVMEWEDEVVPIKNRSKAKSGPWVTDPAEMGKKTVVKRAMKLFDGASIDLTKMIDADNVVNGYVDIPQIETREPISMPVETTATITDTTDTQTTGQQTSGTQSQTATVTAPAGPVISEAQTKRFYAIAKGAKKSDEEIKSFLGFYGFNSSKEITRNVYEEVCTNVVKIIAPAQTAFEPGSDTDEPPMTQEQKDFLDGMK